MFASLLTHPDHLFNAFERLHRELDEALALPSSIRSVSPGSLPPVNVGRTPTHIEVFAFAPGLDAEKIDVTLDRGVLRISGERRAGAPAGDAKRHVYARERSAGSFTRAVALPEDIDPSQVSARYCDGVLQVSIVRRETAQPQRITVQ